MRVYKTVKKETEELEKIICDWCGKEFSNYSNFNGIKNWYEVNEFTLKVKIGESFPEGGSGKKIEIDLCSSCRRKLLDELKKLGITLRESEWDY